MESIGEFFKQVRETKGLTLDDVALWPDRIGVVTPAQIREAARAVFVERNSVIGILLPERTS